ncbi:hypothetical protein [Streptacidiphilus sp. P02-A3a]|uniref:hypothetical protein n=1 Tax=Streptacidiphilus sp. P02-A3a TaxID=2704468 RepID=UPI0015F7BCFB|nr:hypothetical protein [Streptacidiphilus sp. P02-A3a]QMU73213.1 hypothetical protein GXP74_38265 [Streptacidiphilus sp. P02-A3a]
MAGVLLAGAGVAAVFRAEGQAGSVALILTGGLFLLMALSGRTVESIRFGDWELKMGEELLRQASEQARSGHNDQAETILSVLRALNPMADRDPEVYAIEATLFENRVLEAVESARAGDEQVELRPAAGLGEPLAVLVAQPGRTRIGVFAGYALDGSGHIDTAAVNGFIQRARGGSCDAYLFVNGTLHQEDLERLITGIQRDGGRPVGVATWATPAQPTPLRPAVDRLLERVRAPQGTHGTIPSQ